MKKTLVILAFTFILFFDVRSQDTFIDYQKIIENLFLRLEPGYPDDRKMDVNDSVCNLIEKFSVSRFAFNRTFNNIRFLGQIVSPDSLVKIITWNILFKDLTNRYFCYFIKKDGREGNKVFRLSASGIKPFLRTDTTYSQSNWYGALYYDLRPFKSGNELNYLLLGIDYNNPLVTRKIIDVMTFKPNGTIVFGRKCLFNGKEIKYRDIFEFTSNAVMTMRFISDSTVVFSHLSPFSGGMANLPQFYGPDQSFDSYEFSAGLWRLVSDIDIRNEEL